MNVLHPGDAFKENFAFWVLSFKLASANSPRTGWNRLECGK